MLLVVKNLVLIPVHIDPDDAENELEALDDVVEDARETLETDVSFKSITYNWYVKYGTKIINILFDYHAITFYFIAHFIQVSAV